MIKHILFDLGGVLLDINQQKCIDAFVELGAEDIVKHINRFGSKSFFGDLELGKIGESQFRDEVRKIIKNEISDEQIDKAWNSIILDFPKKRIDMLDRLKGKYNLLVLSNTNSIHVRCYESMVMAHTGRHMNTYFDRIFYSHELGLVKPSAEIFNEILRLSGAKAHEVLLIDDAPANTEAALKLGFNVINILDAEEVADYDFDAIENNPKFVAPHVKQ